MSGTLLLAFGALLGRGQPVPAGPLTLDEALAIAQRQAFAVALNRSLVDQARSRTQQAVNGFNPRVTTGVTYTRNDQEVTTSFGPNTPPVVVSPLATTLLVASFSLPLDISGGLRANLRAARDLRRAQEESFLAAVNDLRLNVRVAYYNVLRAQAALTVAQQTLEQAIARRDQARLQFEQAQIARVDLSRFEAQVAQNESDVIVARNQVQLSTNALNQILALPIETPTQVVDQTDLPEAPADAEGTVRAAFGRRAEVRSNEAQIRALDNVRRVVETSDDPTLAVGAQYTRNLDDQVAGFGGRTSSAVGTISFNFPLYDGGITRERVKQARQDVEQARVRLDQTRLNVSAEVRQAITELTNARARVTAATEQVRLAEEVYRIAGIRRDAGEGTYVEVIDALTQLQAARTTLNNARYDALTAFAQLLRATGNEVPEDSDAATRDLRPPRNGDRGAGGVSGPGAAGRTRAGGNS